ncbi:hypothetical protein S40285_03549 [Stachybotrys chlorohalonatus IBT 40285]|uniref:SGF29 C-terminal domain-containing protein n=1 Tax=Stachybotrys chlorohalonatus (strain IBT 40285) TaxID=1283841 RepID=A0A084QVG3_STAC4|nr:hypothetical protein S40285_03549 [Stachybotrys chlorohalonata IBT 40285]
MADPNKKRRRSEIDKLREDVTEKFKGNVESPDHEDRDSKMASQRSRSARANNRNVTQGVDEDAVAWDQCKNLSTDVIAGVNADNDTLNAIVALDKKVGAMDEADIPYKDLDEMDVLLRGGLKELEKTQSVIQATIDKLLIVRAIAEDRERVAQAAAGPSKRSATREAAREANREREAAATPVPPATATATTTTTTTTGASASSLYDFDAAGDSPMPSPIGGSSARGSKLGSGERDRDRERDRGSNRDRDSMPPKADSVEPQGPGLAGGIKSKVLFSKGDAVAFKPRAGAGGSGDAQSDWILGEVAQVLGEGKSRRYKVLDIEPDDHSKQKEYRSSASSMIMITPEDQASTLKDWEAGKVVLALYPNTTTFYKAEVHSMGADGKVDLKFEGENDSTTLQQVERRFVIEYRA